MEGQNILYGNDDDLINVRGLIEARDKVRGEITTLTNEKRRLEKDVMAEVVKQGCCEALLQEVCK